MMSGRRCTASTSRSRRIRAVWAGLSFSRSRPRRRCEVQDGRTLTTDGPFADTKEVFGGYYVFDVANLDEALELAARIPSARLGGKVEVRPIVERSS